MNKLIICIMGPGKKHFAEMCLDSVKGAYKILYWTNIDEEILPIVDKKNIQHFYNQWDETDPTTNGKCRQRYLEHLKENYPDDWVICLDEDEILSEDGIKNIKDFINNDPISTCFSVHMEHFIGDLGHLDNTQQFHFVPHRLFKISDVDKYPEHSHPVLIPKDENKTGKFMSCTIYHLGHLPIEYMDYINHRYKQHSKDSIIHNQQFLHQWKMSHLLGQYPKRQINPTDLPKQLCDRYEIDKDEFYFAKYQLELKHPIMVQQWNNYFKPESVLDLGAGRGCYLYFWSWFCDIYKGIEISNWAVKNSFINRIIQGDISDEYSFGTGVKVNGKEVGWDLITAIDVLEHLAEEQLDRTLKLMSKYGNKFLFSIPYLGDPNLLNDPTHIIKEDKEWWVEKLSQYFIIKDAPTDWLFHEQLLIGERK